MFKFELENRRTNHDDNDDKIDKRISCIKLYVQSDHFVAYGILNRNAHEETKIRIVETDAVINVVQCHTECLFKVLPVDDNVERQI